LELLTKAIKQIQFNLNYQQHIVRFHFHFFFLILFFKKNKKNFFPFLIKHREFAELRAQERRDIQQKSDMSPSIEWRFPNRTFSFLFLSFSFFLTINK